MEAEEGMRYSLPLYTILPSSCEPLLAIDCRVEKPEYTATASGTQATLQEICDQRHSSRVR